MTTRQKFEYILRERGLTEFQATAIMDYAIPLIDAEMSEKRQQRITWDLPASGYADVLYGAWMLSYINKHVLEWAEVNAPLAWWKPMFLIAPEREALFSKLK